MNEEELLPDDRKRRKAERKSASQRDRSKFKKSDLSKREKQLEEKREAKLAKKELARGRVLALSPEGILVEHEGKHILATLSGLLKKEITRVKNLVTVGDFVLIDLDKAMIVSIAPRKTVLARAEHFGGRKQQLIAANIDQVLITVSVGAPPLKPALVDRYIIATRKGGMDPVIVVNKIDLLVADSHEERFLTLFKKTYNSLNLPVLFISATTGEGKEELEKQMKDRASLFSGQSGVGKSSLINLVAHHHLPVGSLAKSQKGAHVTTSAQLLSLPFGGWCIDTPGIRSFGLWDVRKEDLNAYFPEIEAIGVQCKYYNCTHLHEPECAVRQAFEEGSLSPLRFDSYIKLLKELS